MTVTQPGPLLSLLLLASSWLPGISSATETVEYHWEDRFSETERRKLQQWVDEVYTALTRYSGPMPFVVHVYFHRRSAREPVPWGQTIRQRRRQGVELHVDPSYSLDRFLADWTAPHEFSHLLIPYLGRKNAWFAEGFASYMQYQVMHEMGVLSAQQMRRRYAERIRRARRGYRHSQRTFVEAAPRLRAEYAYPTLYWGGAIFFLRADQALREDASSTLQEVLQRYIHCCRTSARTGNLVDLIDELDRVSNTRIFSDQLNRMNTELGFPRHD